MTTTFHENKTPTLRGIRRRRRNPNRPRSKQKYYFTDDTQAKIIEYQNSDDPRERERIFERHIYKPFLEIANSLINVYNFAVFSEREDVAQECAAYLYLNIDKYDPHKGVVIEDASNPPAVKYKAFSYFSVCARNWLIGRAKASEKHAARHVSISSGLSALASSNDIDPSLGRRDAEVYHNSSTIDPPQGRMTREDFSGSVVELWDEMEEEVALDEKMGEHELLIIKSCRGICERAEDLDEEFQKQTSLKKYIQADTGLSRKEYLAAMKNLREVYGLVREFSDEFDEYWRSQ